MEYKVSKRFYDPFKKNYVYPGEVIEVPEKYLEGYKPYIIVKSEAVIDKTDVEKAKPKTRAKAKK